MANAQCCAQQGLTLERTPSGWIQRAAFTHPDLHDELVEELKVPLLLLWGESDPWIVSKLGDKLEACAKGLGKDVKRVSVNAGHCPQDEEPEGVNTALLEFARELGV